MKVLVDNAALAEACSAAARIVARKSTHPAATCLLLEADASGSVLTVTANNFTMQVTYRLDAQVRRSGSACVSAHYLAEYLGELKGESAHTLLATSASGWHLHILDGRFRARLRTISAEEFVPLQSGTPTVYVTLDALDLRQALAESAFAAASHAPVDTAMGNVLLELAGARMSATGMDGLRLSTTSMRMRPVADSEDRTLRMPTKVADELSLMLRNAQRGEEVRLQSDDHALEVTLEGARLVAQLGSGQIPDYGTLIYQEPRVRLCIERLALLHAVDVHAGVARDGPVTRITLRWFQAQEAGLEVSAKREVTLADGKVEAHTSAVLLDATTEGAPGSVVVSGQHLKEALGALPDAQVEILVGDALLVKGDGSARHALVPWAMDVPATVAAPRRKRARVA